MNAVNTSWSAWPRSIGVEVARPNGAFYVFPLLKGYYGSRTNSGRVINNSLEMASYFMEAAHVATVPGEAFGDDDCVRFSYVASMDDLKTGMNRIEAALGELV